MSDAAKLTRKDFTSDQELRWCPGCGDYAIVAAMQSTLAVEDEFLKTRVGRLDGFDTAAQARGLDLYFALAPGRSSVGSRHAHCGHRPWLLGCPLGCALAV